MKRRMLISLVGILAVTFGLLALNIGLGNTPLLGLDLQGGASVTLRPASQTYDGDALPEVANQYREKIESFNIGEAEVVRQGDTIVVNLPGVKDRDKAIELIGTTGKVTFRPELTAQGGFSGLFVPETRTGNPSEPRITVVPTTAPSVTVPASTTPATTAPPGPARVPQQDSTTVPATTTPAPEVEPSTVLVTPADEDLPGSEVYLPDRAGEVLYHLGPVFADGEVAISSAEARLDQQGLNWEVVVTLTGEGLSLWNDMAAKCYSGSAECPARGMAIILDHRVISAPVPQIPSFSSTEVVISGGSDGFTEADSKKLARVLKYGASPIEMKIEASQTVSATLGEDTLRAAAISGTIGVILVILFMLLYYRRLAVVVAGGVILSTLLIWSTVVLFEQFFVLTLAGVLGVVVSVGITVDSYVVYFERLKDEVRHGRSLRNAAQRGFTAAWRTILAANFVALLSALVLWYLSVGSVRGFALFLGLSTLVDLIVTYFFTRPAVYLLAQKESFQGAIFGEVAPGMVPVAAGGGGS